MRFIAKALLASVGAGLAGDFAADVLPEVASDVWDKWNKSKNPGEKKAELESIASYSKDDLRAEVQEIIKEIASDESDALKKSLSTYMMQIPDSVRNAMRRPDDPSGKSVPQYLIPNSPDDILTLLPRWTIVCNGGFRQQSATIRARRKVEFDDASRKCFESIAESLSGTFPHSSFHWKKIRWWMKANILFVEVIIGTEYFPSAYVSEDWATEDAREILANFDAAITDAMA
jgi:hypothetical protein